MTAPLASDIRPAAVAGLFYPERPATLGRMVDDFLATAVAPPRGALPPKALVAPHAGYQYSGPIAASAFAPLNQRRDIERVVLVGPSHRFAFEGVATTGAKGFATPLGIVPVDWAAVEQIEQWPQVRRFERAHADEHCLEVELPFLQQALGRFTLVPLVTGDADDAAVAEVLAALWGGPETLIVVSSDLSHYYDYETAQALDRHTAEAIGGFSPGEIHPEHACGRVAIRGLLHHLGTGRAQAVTLDLRNSGDTAGARDRVVGYGAFALAENAPQAKRLT
jgi:MEMO1 family protein